MRVLQKLEIENFQSHTRTILEFYPGTNVVIGFSDSGKSAIFRALQWAVSNRPLGDAFRSEWGGDTRVVIHTTEGDVIERVRTATQNEYTVNGQVLKAFGADVPEIVANVLRMDPSNIQAQMDAPFLLAATPGDAARLLNKAASIDDIDRAISGLKKDHDTAMKKVKFTEAQLARHQQEMEQYGDIPALEHQLLRIESLEEARNERAAELDKLVSALAKAEYCQTRLKETERVPRLLDRCAQAERKHQQYQTIQASYQRCAELVCCGRDLLHLLGTTEKANAALALVGATETAAAEWARRNDQARQLGRLVASARDLTAALAKAGRACKRLEAEYRAQMPDACPLCGNPVGEKSDQVQSLA